MKRYTRYEYYLKLKYGWDEKEDTDHWKKNPVVYGRKTTDTNKDNEGKIVLQYWFFYVYNDWGTFPEGGNYHEGDWEMIQIILGLDKKPEKYTYSYHHGGQSFPDNKLKNSIEDIEFSDDGNHPHVYVTMGGHGCWNKAGNNVWYQKMKDVKCLKCTDKTMKGESVLYPDIVDFYSEGLKYTLIDFGEEETNWVSWKGYWGDRNKGEGFRGTPSPPYIDYINGGFFTKEGRWKYPIEWADNPQPSSYSLCISDNGKFIVNNLADNQKPLSISEYCNWVGLYEGCDVCSKVNIIYSEEDLQFNVYSLDGEEVTLKINRYSKDTNEVHEVEFDWLEIPKNGMATFKFSHKKNPDFEIMVDNDLDNVIDRIVMPDYSTQYQR